MSQTLIECFHCDSRDVTECPGCEDCCPGGEYVCTDCSVSGRCPECDRAFEKQEGLYLRGQRKRPVSETTCEVCANHAHRYESPAVYCKNCHGAVCSDCLVWEDVCLDCSKEWRKLQR